MTSPTQLTLRLLRSTGWNAQVVERWNPHAKIRQDLFGFADIVAVRADKPGVLAVQTTDVSNQAKRLNKLLGLRVVKVWLLARNRIQVHGWKKVKGLWKVTKREVTLEDLPC